ncbi:MAG: acyl-CoA carboxylase subunit beta [Coprococcus sp.]
MSNKLSLSASDRISALLDDSSFVEVGAYVTARNTDFNIQDKDTPKDGVITGYGVIDGNLVYVYSQDAKVLGGSIGEMHAKKISNLYDMAMKMGAPVIGLIDCAGLRLQEATDALNAFGELYLKQSLASGVIPQITAIFGTCGGGAALIPTLTDFTFMTKEGSKLFVNSPNALEENNITKLDTSAAEYVSVNTSNVDAVFETEEELLGSIRALVDILPCCNEDEGKFDSTTDDMNRIIPNLDSFKNDGRAVLQNISDNSFIMEMKKDFATDIVTAFIKLNGVAVGCVVNQEDIITTNGAYKAEEFIDFCDSFNIPVLTLVNVKGFAATVREEKIISKALAKLTYAYADATVPKVTVIMDKAYGTAYTVMNSKSIGADMVFAWPDAVIGTMDPEMAVKIMYEDEIAAASDKLAFIKDKKKEYTEALSGALSAARRGYIDDIIEPDATRKRVIAAFEMLLSKRESRPYKKHGTI